MKKFLILVIVFFGLQSFAQKTVIVNNFSSLQVTIFGLNTITNTNAQYPSIRSVTPANIIIPAGQSRTMSSPTGSLTQFPFNSTASAMQYTNWRRFTSATTSTPLTITQVMPFANANKFNFVEMTVGSTNFKIGTGLNASSVTSATGSSGSTNFTITYTENVIAPGNVQYIVQIN
jgi:hypothetical protein